MIQSGLSEDPFPLDTETGSRMDMQLTIVPPCVPTYECSSGSKSHWLSVTRDLFSHYMASICLQMKFVCFVFVFKKEGRRAK